MFLMSNKIIVSDKAVPQKQSTRHVYEHTGYLGCGNGSILCQVLIAYTHANNFLLAHSLRR